MILKKNYYFLIFSVIFFQNNECNNFSDQIVDIHATFNAFVKTNLATSTISFLGLLYFTGIGNGLIQNKLAQNFISIFKDNFIFTNDLKNINEKIKILFNKYPKMKHILVFLGILTVAYFIDTLKINNENLQIMNTNISVSNALIKYLNKNGGIKEAIEKEYQALNANISIISSTIIKEIECLESFDSQFIKKIISDNKLKNAKASFDKLEKGAITFIAVNIYEKLKEEDSYVHKVNILLLENHYNILNNNITEDLVDQLKQLKTNYLK